MDVDCYDTLDGQVALVTGATRGIGEAIAGDLATLGATVYAGARDPGDVPDDDVEPIRLDVGDEAEVAAAIDRIEREAARLDVLVNNAGVYGPSAAVGDTETADLDQTLKTNLRGPFLATKRALPLLLDRRGGRVVNVSSRGGQFASGMAGDHAAYRISKAGLNALTTTLEGAYGHRGLLANAYCPGWVRTDMGGAGAPNRPEEGADTGVFLARFREGSPSGRFWADREIIEW